MLSLCFRNAMQLSVKDVAKYLNVAEKTVYRWIKRDRIPVYRINEQCRFNRAEIIEWATAERIPFQPALLVKNDDTDLPDLHETLRNGGIFYRLEGDDKPSVLQHVVEVMPLPEEVDREFLYQVLLARENLGSTGVGDGIAIPHVRNPIVLHVIRPVVTLCFLEQPIAFNSVDGQPVDTLFTMVSPTVRAHLHLLLRLGYVIQNPEFRSVLRQQAAREEIFQALITAEETITVPND